MNEKAKISISWLVTVIMVPIIGFSGIRMVNGLDEIANDVEQLKIQQAVTNQRLQSLEVAVRKPQ